MPTSVPVVKGDNTVLFGADGVYSGNGIVTGGNKKTTGDKIEVFGPNGAVVAVIYFNDKKECSFKMAVKTAAPDLERGDPITLCGVAYCLVDDANEIWSNKDVRMFEVNATKYAEISGS